MLKIHISVHGTEWIVVLRIPSCIEVNMPRAIVRLQRVAFDLISAYVQRGITIRTTRSVLHNRLPSLTRNTAYHLIDCESLGWYLFRTSGTSRREVYLF